MNYKVDMYERKKHRRIFHVNMPNMASDCGRKFCVRSTGRQFRGNTEMIEEVTNLMKFNKVN